MSTSTPLTTTPPLVADKPSPASIAKKRLSSPWASIAAIVIAVLWTLPTFGLLVSSFRPERAIKTTGWWTFFSDPTVTLENYSKVFGEEGGVNLAAFFVNSLIICIPSVLIPMSLAALSAYAFAWIKFPGRNVLFLMIFALQIVPLQVTLIPLLKIFVSIDITGTFWTLWLSHATFALPLAIYLLHNFMREIPSGLIEAARVDGAGHVSIFFKVMLPLLTPALAAFGIFQFLWVWNDLLVALVFAGGGNEVAPITLQLANLSGTRGTAWHLLSAGAFVSILVPVTVFLLLQRYFVRGLLAGSVKG
ncbi:carbohydrate ABC transporter permease [Paractinoplanes brasiliensis]|uniref:Carbohydrate ABC transporter membrane protein 2 (CUT1 family) n=1 Tax=Paractinoplanes brasiliensis TaxID=52695 RepID=A0A4R6J721_9ACTN|nr:carbohydrate ABC transporter permease [Actinoplanes brasiliensis]TDO31313.1 carbohydrate ABC transporter membrane protein 2 (CUT1 family) [Actinoplanes brasiliensis]GID28364.1 sugar ABC transporter permease [Actinoplanes brasiliensis]